ncbi:SMI1/KNR4 family protein [Motilimonas sp. 1_MG-2023]|uniref:SMI1/KNR4 family protein n=1 Tax=Motilimonas sp. 1_MG-2023 TaxID=3062672 RepID=UPI0026E23D24|nr:SMI1/KNR4 family protein [Motilimonas sp. 1_MG-2023]MDO6527290.1 SMI1/KNR4 family protein [Motilimonas sp. 1_MG-2023]
MKNISIIEQYFDSPLPKEYREFLSSHQGELDGDVYLYLPEDLIERNECYETKEYAPGYISIGDNGGGMAFILSLNENDSNVYAVGRGSMVPSLKELVSSSFQKWLEEGLVYEEE